MAAQLPSSESLISVIIPHLNQPDSLETCLSSLDDQTLDRSLFEVIVVDNGSTCSPEHTIARHPRTTLLHELQSGPGPARNRGVQHAAGGVLAFIDADCRADPNWLAAIHRAISSVPEGTVLGGDVHIWRDAGGAFTAIQAYETIFSYRFKLFIEKHGFCGTGNMALRRSDYDKVGPFAGVQIAEDVEWGQRARAAGLKFRFFPEIIVFHPARGSLQELCIKWQRHIQHSHNEVRGRPLWRIYWVARAFAVLCSPIVDGVEVLLSKQLQGISVRLKALSILAVVRAYRAWKMVSLMGSHREIVWNKRP